MTRDYEQFLDEELQDSGFALGYLNLALEEYDPKTFQVVLGDLVRAQGESVTEVAKNAGLSREHLHRMLSPRGNPAFASVLALLEALDFQLAIKPKRKSRPKHKKAAKKPVKRRC